MLLPLRTPLTLSPPKPPLFLHDLTMILLTSLPHLCLVLVPPSRSCLRSPFPLDPLHPRAIHSSCPSYSFHLRPRLPSPLYSRHPSLPPCLLTSNTRVNTTTITTSLGEVESQPAPNSWTYGTVSLTLRPVFVCGLFFTRPPLPILWFCLFTSITTVSFKILQRDPGL